MDKPDLGPAIKSASTDLLIGIGACLAGQAVRYDGSNRPANPSVLKLREAVSTTAFCPEVGTGMPVPRPPIHVVGNDAREVRALDVASHQVDDTAALQNYAHAVLDYQPQLCGYLLVSRSPSCGYRKVKRFDDDGRLIARDSQGVFAANLQVLNPLLPLEDDAGLRDPGLRESFVSRLCVYHNWQNLLETGSKDDVFNRFFALHVYLIEAHQPGAGRKLESMIAEPRGLQSEAFISTLMSSLRQPATRRSHSRVIAQLIDDLKDQLSMEEHGAALEIHTHYRLGESLLEESTGALLQQLRPQLQTNQAINFYLSSCSRHLGPVELDTMPLVLGRV